MNTWIWLILGACVLVLIGIYAHAIITKINKRDKNHRFNLCEFIRAYRKLKGLEREFEPANDPEAMSSSELTIEEIRNGIKMLNRTRPSFARKAIAANKQGLEELREAYAEHIKPIKGLCASDSISIMGYPVYFVPKLPTKYLIVDEEWIRKMAKSEEDTEQ